MNLTQNDEADDQTDPDLFRSALPQASIHEDVTAPWSIVEPLYLTRLAPFDRGVAHALDVVHRRLLERMEPELAQAVIAWVKEDPSISS